MVGDIVALLAGFDFGGWIYLGSPGAALALNQAQLVLPIYLTLALYNGSYSMSALERPGFAVRRALFALMIAVAFVVFIAFYAKFSAEISRFAFSIGAAGAALLIAWARSLTPAIVRWRCGDRVVNVLLIDDGGPSLDLPEARTVSAERIKLSANLADPRALDRIGQVLRNFERVVVSCPPERRLAWAMILKGANVAGEVVDEAVEQLAAQGARRAGGTGLLLVSLGPLGFRARAIKRAFDLTLALLGVIVAAPLLLLVAFAILIEDGRPILFTQQRVGRSNRLFSVYKFRSMRCEAADAGPLSTARGDSRITRVGRLIRRTSIDELPQLFNVLLGQMSLVGPRPHALGSLAGDKLFWEVDSRYWQRHALKPGLTGLAQIRGLRGATDLESDLSGRLNADLEYLSGWTLLRDVQILFATLRVLVHHRAY
ncbi:MAG: sugar transferase [Novosphingobium sp.]